MPLSGTLANFGIAEAFQLIGKQEMSGVLHVARKGEQIDVTFSRGNIVRVDAVTRGERDRLGMMLVRAGLVTAEQLADALDVQARTLQRLGDLLVIKELIREEDLQQMVQLQMSEAVWKLFGWRRGTYTFEDLSVVASDPGFAPVPAERAREEALRQVGEWPKIRAVITSGEMTFVPLRFAEVGAPGAEVPPAVRAERRCFELAEAGRAVREIVDLSRLGEYATCSILADLVRRGRLAPGTPVRKQKLGPLVRALREWAGAAVANLGMALLVAGAVLGLAYLHEALAAAARASDAPFADAALQHLAGETERARIASALAVHRLEQGSFPASLADLLAEGLLSARDLHYPFAGPWTYQREGEGYLLLPPVE